MTRPVPNAVLDPDEADYRQRLQRALGPDFKLGERIGQGGFGSVYAARDLRLDREVAVKALRQDLFPTRAVLERFQLEARAVAKLRHPNILPVYAVGEGEGIAFMIMPLIRGESLATALEREGTLPPAEAVRIATGLARGLDAAHRLGIVHRDVKPDNIFLEGDDRHVLLGDFGIAKTTQVDTGITGTGMIVGTPRYMSPEQSTGDKDIDARSDVYALGAVTYEMLGGRAPFEAETLHQLLIKRFTTDPMPLAELDPDVGQPLSDVVMRSLARTREGRWSSAADFADSLQTASGLTPQTVFGQERSQESWLARRGPLVIGLGGAMFYLDITFEVLSAAGDREAAALVSPVITLLQFGIPLLFADMLARSAIILFDGGSWKSALRAALGQPRWWQAWYPRALRHPANMWDRMPFLIKALRTLLAIDLATIPLALPLIYFVPQLVNIAAGGNHALPLLMRVVIGAATALAPLLAASVAGLVGGVATVSMRKGVSFVRVLECLLTWRRDRWSVTEQRRLLSTSAA